VAQIVPYLAENGNSIGFILQESEDRSANSGWLLQRDQVPCSADGGERRLRQAAGQEGLGARRERIRVLTADDEDWHAQPTHLVPDIGRCGGKDVGLPLGGVGQLDLPIRPGAGDGTDIIMQSRVGPGGKEGLGPVVAKAVLAAGPLPPAPQSTLDQRQAMLQAQ